MVLAQQILSLRLALATTFGYVYIIVVTTAICSLMERKFITLKLIKFLFFIYPVEVGYIEGDDDKCIEDDHEEYIEGEYKYLSLRPIN